LLVRLFERVNLRLPGCFLGLQLLNFFPEIINLMGFPLTTSDCTFTILKAFPCFLVIIWIIGVFKRSSTISNVLIQILELFARQLSYISYRVIQFSEQTVIAIVFTAPLLALLLLFLSLFIDFTQSIVILIILNIFFTGIHVSFLVILLIRKA